MTRFTVDVLDVLLGLLRPALPGVTVFPYIPDGVTTFMPLVVIRRTGGDSLAPEFYDTPLINVQCWCADDRDNNIDASRAASDLADQVRGILWTAYRTQQVVPALGWIGAIRESTGPLEISDPDLPNYGRYSATYDLRIRSAG
jgi:hypothetical protein